MSESDKGPAPVISDAIWVVTLTAASYIVAYSYESGFAKYFNIPTSLISISPTLLMSAAGSILVAALPVYTITNAIWPLLPPSTSAFARSTRILILQTLLLGFLLSPFLMQGEGWFLLGGITLLTTFSEFVFPMLTHRKIKIFEQKLVEQEKIELGVIPLTLVGKAIERFGKVPATFLLFILMMSLFANLLGAQNAKQRQEYFVLKGDRNMALLVQYDSLFVSQSYDAASKQLSGNLVVAKLDEGKDIELLFSNIGPLKPQKIVMK